MSEDKREGSTDNSKVTEHSTTLFALLFNEKARNENKVTLLSRDLADLDLQFENLITERVVEIEELGLTNLSKSNKISKAVREGYVKDLVNAGELFVTDVGEINKAFIEEGGEEVKGNVEKFDKFYRISYITYTKRVIEANEAYTRVKDEHLADRERAAEEVQAQYESFFVEEEAAHQARRDEVIAGYSLRLKQPKVKEDEEA